MMSGSWPVRSPFSGRVPRCPNRCQAENLDLEARRTQGNARGMAHCSNHLKIKGTQDSAMFDESPHIAESSRNPLESRGRSEPQCAAFYLAIPMIFLPNLHSSRMTLPGSQRRQTSAAADIRARGHNEV